MQRGTQALSTLPGGGMGGIGLHGEQLLCSSVPTRPTWHRRACACGAMPFSCHTPIVPYPYRALPLKVTPLEAWRRGDSSNVASSRGSLWPHGLMASWPHGLMASWPRGLICVGLCPDPSILWHYAWCHARPPWLGLALRTIYIYALQGLALRIVP